MSVPARPPLWTKDYALTLVGTVGFFASFFYLLSVLPEYIDEIGGAKWQIGVVVGGFSIVPLVLRPFVGRWSDRGHRKSLMRFGLASMVLSLLLMTLSQDVLSLFLLRVVQGIGVATYPTGAASLIVEVSPASRRGEGVGFFGMATGVAQMVAPPVGVLVAEQWGFDAVFVLAAVTAFVTLIVVQPVREPPLRPGGESHSSKLIPRPALFPMAIFMSVTFSFSAAATFLPLLGEERNLGNVGLFFLFAGAAAIVTRPAAGLLSDRFGRVPVVAPGLVATWAAMWLLALAHGPPMMLLAGVAAGIGLGAAHTGLLALAIDSVGDAERGRATAVLQLAWDTSGFLGAIVLGIVASVFDVATVYWISGAVAFIALPALLGGPRVAFALQSWRG